MAISTGGFSIERLSLATTQPTARPIAAPATTFSTNRAPASSKEKLPLTTATTATR